LPRCDFIGGFYTLGNLKSVLVSSILLLTLCGGCVRRQIAVTSNPSGALVYMNDQEVGRTPFVRDFTWYGRYEVAVRADGYEPLKTHTSVYAPWWQWVPLDAVTDLFPVTDRHELNYSLKPASTQPTEATTVLARAAGLQKKLESP